MKTTTTTNPAAENKIDFKKFKISDLRTLLNNGVHLHTINKDSGSFKKIELKKIEAEFLTISDYSESSISKGSENLYFNFTAYFLTFDKGHLSETPIEICLYSKDAHQELKKVIQEHLNQI